jgi:hypothetical protein
MSERSWLGPLLVAWLASACIDSAAPDLSQEVAGAIDGQITDRNGAAVPEPVVTLVLLSQPLGGQSRQLSQAVVTGGSNGRFVVGFILQRVEPQTALLNLSVSPPIGSNLLPADTVGIPVRLARGFPPVDTTVVILALPPR